MFYDDKRKEKNEFNSRYDPRAGDLDTQWAYSHYLDQEIDWEGGEL